MDRCADCKYFEITPDIAIPNMVWEGEMQGVDIIKSEHDGICTHEYNWRPSRGDMPCDMGYHCSNFERGM